MIFHSFVRVKDITLRDYVPLFGSKRFGMRREEQSPRLSGTGRHLHGAVSCVPCVVIEGNRSTQPWCKTEHRIMNFQNWAGRAVLKIAEESSLENWSAVKQSPEVQWKRLIAYRRTDGWSTL